VSRLCVRSFAVSIDGYGAGPGQDLQNPLGVRGTELMEWFFRTLAWRKMHGEAGGEAGVDNAIAEQGFAGIGAWILGRNMFGPVRGPWPDESWRGWWGDEPPYHTKVFVLTHYPRSTLKMAGGTEFHFVTSGIHDALEQARSAAGGRDVRLGGGVATVRQYLEAGLIDELDTDSLLHLRRGLWIAGLSRVAADLRHRAGMQGGWQCVAEPQCQSDAGGCELHLQLRQLPVKKNPGTFAPGLV